MRPLQELKTTVIVVALCAAVVAKWQISGGDPKPWDWVLNLFIACLVVVEVLEITYRLLRKRRATDDVYSPVPGRGPPGWAWDSATARWRPPDPS